MDVMLRICEALDCEFDDIIEKKILKMTNDGAY